LRELDWTQGTGTLVDSLIITGCQFGGTNTQIDINNILHLQVTGCYFLDTLYMFNITTPNDRTISGNCFFANGTKAYGITVSGDQGTGGLVISGNTFFGFNNLDYFPITLGSGTNRNLVSSNLFYSCTQFINDSGISNMTEYAQSCKGVVYNGNRIFQTGIFAHATSSLSGANISGPMGGNNLVLTGAASGSAPILETFGNDADINLQFITKRTGVVQFTSSVEFNSSISMTALPTTQPSASGFLWNNSGVLNIS